MAFKIIVARSMRMKRLYEALGLLTNRFMVCCSGKDSDMVIMRISIESKWHMGLCFLLAADVGK